MKSIFYGRSGNKRLSLSELKSDVKFCEIEEEIYQATYFFI